MISPVSASRARSFTIALFVAAAPTVALAQQATGIATDRFAPGIGPVALFAGEGGEVTGPGQISGALSLGFLRDPLRLTSQQLGTPIATPVHGALTTDLSLEVGVYKRIAVAIGVPVVLFADGDRLRGTGTDDRPLSYPVGGDLRMRVKVSFVGNPTQRGLHLALALQVTAPLGGQDTFFATSGVTVEPRLFADLRYGRVLACAALGVRFADDRQLFNTVFGDEFTWIVGAAVELYARAPFFIAAIAELGGAIGSQAGTRPVEIRAGLRGGFRRVSLDLAGGAGLDSDVGAPSWRVLGLVRLELDPFSSP